jgi:hypothetical protein
MDLPDDELTFLRDLVKSSRQRTVHVKWVDRDGSARITALSQAEAVRLNAVAERLRLSASETLRQAAHVPAVRPGKPAAPVPPEQR